MFKYSHRFLEKLAGEPIDYKDFDRNWLDLQGFEVACEEEMNDDAIVELEVKANRPDMLSHLGVLREYYVYKKYNKEPKIESKVDLSGLKNLPIDVEIKTDDVGNLVLVCIKNIDNTKKTPEKIVKLLHNLGVASVNPIVDFSNFVMLELGQPIHVYDLDKLNAKLEFDNLESDTKLTTINGSEITAPKGSIIIKDSNGAVCLAGIIGTQKVEVDENTKNIVIESANFNPIKLRVASQNTHISTLASYRYERGVDANITKLGACLCAEYILENCGGQLDSAFVKFENSKDNKKRLEVSYINKILGTKFSAQDIKKLLESYYYTVSILDEQNIEVIAPNYRLDLDDKIDVVGDVAQIFGYHNIEPTMPNLSVEYEPNDYIINSDILRNLLYGVGANECISYSFIHENAMKMLKIDEKSELFGDIKLINPLSNKFALMRPNLIYSMVNTLVYNVAKDGVCEPIFEIGTVFKRDASTDTGYGQNSHLAVVLCGNKIEKGFGIDKNVPYDFYDIKQVLELIMAQYSMQFELVEKREPTFELCADILVGGKKFGVIGILDDSAVKNFENGKLVREKVYYLEINIDMLSMGTTALEEQSKFPSITREYNLLVPTDVKFADYKAEIEKTSNKIINIEVKDLYKGKGVKEGTTSQLIQITYNSFDETLTSEEVEAIERQWFERITATYKIVLKG